jgi:glyoxylase-like metal-dependent hydrolase (beta-lactamase superfamily II)
MRWKSSFPRALSASPIRIRRALLDVEFTGFLDQKRDFFSRNGWFWHCSIPPALFGWPQQRAAARDDPLRGVTETSIFASRNQRCNARPRGKRRMHWNVGKVKITKIVELETTGSTRFILPLATNEEIRQMPWLIPHFANEEGRLKMSIHSLVVETPSRRIVVDTGLGNDKEGRKVPTWNNRKDAFLETMTSAGFPTDSIDTVLCTHLHVDHVGWNTKLAAGQWIPTFGNARYVFGKTEYEHWRDHSDESDKVAVFNDSVKPIVDAGRAELVASDARLADEITLIPTPGHSPGHMSIHIKSDGEEGLLTGDVAHHPCQMAHLDWSSTADSDPVQSTVTRRELFSRFADTPTLVIGGHFNAGHIRRDGDAFKFMVWHMPNS